MWHTFILHILLSCISPHAHNVFFLFFSPTNYMQLHHKLFTTIPFNPPIPPYAESYFRMRNWRSDSDTEPILNKAFSFDDQTTHFRWRDCDTEHTLHTHLYGSEHRILPILNGIWKYWESEKKTSVYEVRLSAARRQMPFNRFQHTTNSTNMHTRFGRHHISHNAMERNTWTAPRCDANTHTLCKMPLVWRFR